ncbi:hypothetical protein [Pseudomonas sp. Q1-7]|nr:hypothetical protein [Pseudomonas sp. Q1-7]
MFDPLHPYFDRSGHKLRVRDLGASLDARAFRGKDACPSREEGDPA